MSIGMLASETGAARSTVSEAVGALSAVGLVGHQRHGRRAEVQLAGPEVAEMLEALGRIAGPSKPRGLRAAARMAAMCRARTCYDHLAGSLGVELSDLLLQTGALARHNDAWLLTPDGRNRLLELGVDPEALRPTGRRPLVRVCVDWTERRPHLAGRAGAGICALWLGAGLAQRLPGSRALRVTPEGEDWLGRLRAGA